MLPQQIEQNTQGLLCVHCRLLPYQKFKLQDTFFFFFFFDKSVFPTQRSYIAILTLSPNL